MKDAVNEIIVKYNPLADPQNQAVDNSHVVGEVYVFDKHPAGEYFGEKDYIGEIYFDKVEIINDGSFAFELNFCHRNADVATPEFLQNITYSFPGEITEGEIMVGVARISNEIGRRYIGHYKKEYTSVVVNAR